MAISGSAAAAMIIFKTLGAAHLAGGHVIAAHSLVHAMSSGHLAALWIKNHLKEKLIGDVRDKVVEKLTEGIPAGAKRAAVQALLLGAGQITIEDAIDIVNAEIDEKYELPDDMVSQADLFYMAFLEVTKKDGFLDKFKCNLLSTGENSTAKAKYESHIVNLTKLNLPVEVKDYNGRLLAVRMPGKTVLNRIVRPREVVRIPTSENHMEIAVRYRNPKTNGRNTMIEDVPAPHIYAIHDVRESFSIKGSFVVETMDDFEALEDRLAGRTDKDKKTSVKCPKKHDLTYCWARNHICDICKKSIKGRMWSCRSCDWDCHKICAFEIQDPNFKPVSIPKVVVSDPVLPPQAPPVPSLSIVGNSVRVTWNHDYIPEDVSLVCVFGRKKTDQKFGVVDSSQGNKLVVQGKSNGHHQVRKGGVNVSNLDEGVTYEFKLVWYYKKKSTWGPNGKSTTIKMQRSAPHAPMVTLLGNNSARVKWNHKVVPSDCTFVCVFGRTKSETKFRTVDSSQGNQLVVSNANTKHHSVSKGFVDVPNLTVGSVYEFKLVWYASGKWGPNGAVASITMEYTPHAPSLRVLNNTSIRVTWNHKSCPKDATLCCVFGRNIKSTGGKFKTAIPKTGTLENDNPDKKYFLVGNGFADVKNLVLNETYEFKLVFYCKKTNKWGRNGTCSRIKMSLLPPAPVL